jgi:hypothetical protein
LLQRDNLRATLSKLNYQAAGIDQQIAAGEEERERFGKDVLASGTPYAQEKFKQARERIAEKRETLRICQEQNAKTQKEIDALALNPEQQKLRSERQEELARSSHHGFGRAGL